MRLDRIRIERSRSFGHVWLGWTLWRALDLDRLCGDWMVDGREQIPWATMAAILTIARLCEPSSELHIAEDWYRRTALEDLLGVPSDQVNDDRLYRALDRLLPHKTAIEQHLKNRLGELFALEYDLLLYDVTSTYFEGLAATSRRASKRDSSASDAASRARRRNSIEDPSSARSVGCSVATREPRAATRSGSPTTQAPRAGCGSTGRYAPTGTTGRDTARAATCCAPTSTTGRPRRSGKHTCS